MPRLGVSLHGIEPTEISLAPSLKRRPIHRHPARIRRPRIEPKPSLGPLEHDELRGLQPLEHRSEPYRPAQAGW
jgi:hypothetical protein